MFHTVKRLQKMDQSCDHIYKKSLHNTNLSLFRLMRMLQITSKTVFYENDRTDTYSIIKFLNYSVQGES